MNRFDKWVTLTANLGVVAGLIILAAEVNQNTNAMIATASSDIYDQSLGYFALGMDNEVIAVARFKFANDEELTPFESDQLWWYQYYNFRIFENIYLQHRRGYLERHEWLRYARIIQNRLANDPYAQRVWTEREFTWTQEFKDEVKKLMNADL